MKVRAKDVGYYDHRRRREGDEFRLYNSEDFSDKWMEKLDSEPVKKKARRSPKKKEEVAAVSSDTEVI